MTIESRRERGCHWRAVVIGTSQGGFEALHAVLDPLPADFPIPILVVRHHASDSDDYLITSLNAHSPLTIAFARGGERPLPGHVYIAPPDNHLLVDESGHLRLSHGPQVYFSRPAIDPLFSSAARAYGPDLIGVVMTGANSDGAVGAVEIKKNGGCILVQEPRTAEAATMPEAVLERLIPDRVIWLDQIGPYLWSLATCRGPASL
ncbi:MAG: chemotaxis protein CheB [Magnetococcales bacterium]|nr:chemotaxis protein CheB [Magnetococcales bacterium]